MEGVEMTAVLLELEFRDLGDFSPFFFFLFLLLP